MTIRALQFLPLVLLANAAFAAEPAHQPDAAGFAGVVQPFLKEHCVSCHGPKKQKGDLRLDTLANTFLDPATVEKWKDVVNTVSSHEMPPEDERQPAAESAGQFTDWLTAELGRAEIAKRSTTTVMRRMNRAEYNNTIRDLVGVDFQPAEKFRIRRRAASDNIGEALTISPLHLELYHAARGRDLDRALFEGAAAGAEVALRAEEYADKSDGARETLTGNDQADRTASTRPRTASRWCITANGTRS